MLNSLNLVLNYKIRWLSRHLNKLSYQFHKIQKIRPNQICQRQFSLFKEHMLREKEGFCHIKKQLDLIFYYNYLTKSFNCISSLTKRHVYFRRYAENTEEETLVNRKKIQPIPLYICVAPLFMNISFKTVFGIANIEVNLITTLLLLINFFFFSVYAKSLVSYSSR